MSIKAIGQLTIVDLTDPIVSPIEPENKFKDMIWMDTSVTPYVMKIWTGSRWEIVGSDEDEIDQLKRRMNIIETEVIESAYFDFDYHKNATQDKIDCAMELFSQNLTFQISDLPCITQSVLLIFHH